MVSLVSNFFFPIFCHCDFFLPAGLPGVAGVCIPGAADGSMLLEVQGEDTQGGGEAGGGGHEGGHRGAHWYCQGQQDYDQSTTHLS